MIRLVFKEIFYEMGKKVYAKNFNELGRIMYELVLEITKNIQTYSSSQYEWFN